MAGKGRLSTKAKLNRGELRDLFTQQMLAAVERRGFVDQLFIMLDEIKDPDKKLRCALEILKFTMPQLASQRVEVVQEETPVTRIVFAPSAVPSTPKAIESK